VLKTASNTSRTSTEIVSEVLTARSSKTKDDVSTATIKEISSSKHESESNSVEQSSNAHTTDEESGNSTATAARKFHLDLEKLMADEHFSLSGELNFY
jgi:hypothetical protein